MNADDAIGVYITELTHCLQALSVRTVDRIAGILARARADGRTVFLLGNGGSAATASHMACDFAKTAIRPDMRRLRAVALTDNVPLLTAWANDAHYRNVFAEQIENLICRGDVVIAISGSGRSANVLEAVRRARQAGAVTVGLTGFDGGDLVGLVDACLVVPSEHMGQIEDVHLAVGHMLADVLRHLPEIVNEELELA